MAPVLALPRYVSEKEARSQGEASCHDVSGLIPNGNSGDESFRIHRHIARKESFVAYVRR
ncbi:MAG: hypothetical protein ACMUIA_12390 [bacterium]